MSLFVQAMLQDSVMVLKCKLSYSQLLAAGFAPRTGVEHGEHLAAPHTAGMSQGCAWGAAGGEGGTAGGRRRGWR